MYKVLRVIPSLDPKLGGVVTTIKELFTAIHNAKKQDLIDVEILCFDDPGSDWLSAYQDETVHTLSGGWRGFSYNRMYFKWLKDNAHNYDLVVVDGLWQYHSLAPLLLRKLNVPCVMFAHGMLDPYFNQFRFKYYKKLIFCWFIYQKVFKLCDRVLFTCLEEQLLAKKSLPIANFKSEIVKIGISPPLSLDNILNVPDFYCKCLGIVDKKVCLFLSRLHPKKGVMELLEAISMNEIFFRNSNYVFVIAGNGDQSFVNKIKQRVDELNLHQMVYMPGGLYDEDKWCALKYADVLILPTHQENFGLVLAEALSVGTPVITTNKTNVWRDIKGSEVGLVCEDNAQSISHCLMEWISLDNTSRNIICSNTMRCFELNFSGQAYLDSFIKMSKKVVESAKTQ